MTTRCLTDLLPPHLSMGSRFTRLAVGLVLAFVVTSPPAFAADEATTEEAKPAPEQTFSEQFEEVWNRDRFTGDWMGWRTQLLDHGIDAQFRLSQYGQWVADGGNDTSGAYGATLDYRVNTNLKKLFGLWDGLAFNMHARTRWGQDILSDAGELTLPNAGLMMPAPGGYDDTDVTGLVVSQTLPFFGGRLANITLGKIDVIDTVTGFFPSVGYGQEGFQNINALVTAMPWFGAVQGLSLYGAFAVTINTEFQMAETGFLALGTEGVSTSWSGLQDSFEDGVFLAGFQRIFWKLDDKPGYFMVFAGGSTKDQASNDPNDWVNLPGPGVTDTSEKKPWDIAAYIYQVLWQAEKDPSRKATLFMGGTAGPDNPQFAQYHFFTSFEAFGPMASRPRDRMGVSGWYNWLSNDFKDLVAPVSQLRDTWGFEIYYNISVTQWLHVTPDMQFVKNENEGDDLAFIPGIRVVLDF